VSVRSERLELVHGQPRPGAWLARAAGVPTRRLVLLFAAPLVLSVGVLFAPAVTVPLVALDLVLVGLALGDLVAARGVVEAARAFSPVQAVGRPFEVRLQVTNVGTRPLQLRFTDDAPGITEGLPLEASLAPGAAAEGRYALAIDRRGQHHFGDVTVRWTSPLGLWERQRRVAIPGTVRVYPDFAQLRHYGLRGPQARERVPVRARRRPGGENEFERLRPYVPGDPYRHIDWKATARRREFVTREFGQESNQNLIFLLDAGRMMSGRSGSLTAFDHALNAAVMMGQVALKHGDRVGLLAFDGTIRAWLPPKAGVRSANRLIRGTYDLFPSLEEPDYALAFRYLTQRVRRRSLVVLLTAVVDEPNAELATQLVQALGSRHLACAAWIRDVGVDDLWERPADTPRDVYVRGAAAELLGWRERALAGLRRRGALVVDCAPGELTPSLLGRYLEIKARRLL
jgi:uncharacterized protein (DUF58 family)